MAVLLRRLRLGLVALFAVAIAGYWVTDLPERGRPPRKEMWLEPVGDPFEPPIKILALKETDPAVAAVRAFRPGAGTLFETNDQEASILLKACGVSPKLLE
jgi:hypothetical protein